jgi:hypothetical protein
VLRPGKFDLFFSLTVGRADSSSVEDRGKYPERGGLTGFGKVSEINVQTENGNKKIDHQYRKFFLPSGLCVVMDLRGFLAE